MLKITSRFCCASLPLVAKRSIAMRMAHSTSVAVVLSGCGVYDGSEIHEASAVLVSLSRNSAEYKCYAPDIQQMHVINHTNGQEMREQRNVLVESARIARGAITPLSQLDVDKHDAIILPGGFGAAKNLSNFAVKQADMQVNEDVARSLKAFHKARKPVGLCCIAPVIAAKVFPGCEVTMGQDSEQGGRFPYAGATGVVPALGSTHVNKEVTEVHVDVKNKLVTTPAFMCEAKIHDVHDGVGAMVCAVLQLARS